MKKNFSVVLHDSNKLNASERAAICRVCVAANQDDGFNHLFSFILSGGRHFLGYHKETLVCHAVVTTRWLQPQGMEPLKTAYVDAVSTLPHFQGRGYASALMMSLAENIGDYQIACLQTDIPQFYSRIGWIAWKGALFGRKGTELIPTPDMKGVMVLLLPQTPCVNIDSYISIESQAVRIW